MQKKLDSMEQISGPPEKDEQRSMGGIARSACDQHNFDDVFVEPHWQTRGLQRRGTLHCIEPMPATSIDLKAAADKLQISAHGFVVSHAAISTITGTTQFPGNGLSGKEDAGIWSCESNPKNCINVPMYKLDDFVKKFVFDQGPIDVLQIDVEGYDFEVFRGASEVLERSRYLEYMYHNVGKWKDQYLEDAVNLLQEKRFTYYWAGKGKLWRLTKCWISTYNEWHGWSNVACVAVDEIDLLWSMEKIFLKAQLDQIRLDPTSFDVPSSCPTQFLCWNRFEIYLIRLLHLHNNVRGFSEDVLLDEAGLH